MTTVVLYMREGEGGHEGVNHRHMTTVYDYMREGEGGHESWIPRCVSGA